MSEPRILLFDIETSPLLSHTWGRYEQNVIEVEREWFMLSFAYKFLDEKKITVCALPDYRGYKTDKTCDKLLVTDLWKLFDQADILVGHNLDHFDVKKAQARFAIHGLKPPSPFKTVDTLKIARKAFAFSSNRLDHLGQQLDVGRKLPNTGKSLWLGCMSGDERSWTMMRRYNAQDVALLERVYLKLRAWSTTHPDLTLFTRKDACPVCESAELMRTGWNYTRTGKRQRATCRKCGHRFTYGKLIREAA